MVVIRLYGVLEDMAQRSIRVNARSFDECLRALFANFPGLRAKIRDIRMSVLVDGKAISFEDCLRPMVSERIDIMPVVGGTGPAIPIIIGAMMTYGAEMIATTAFMELGLSLAATAALQTFMVNMGVSLILGGISQILFKPPKANLSSERPDSAASYNFNGAVNTISQGNVVPVGFGRMRVGSQVISVNVQTVEIPIQQPPTTPDPSPASATDISISYDLQIA